MKLKRKVSRINSVINGSKHKWPEHTTLFKMTRLPAALSSVSSLAICQYPHAKCCNLWNFHLWPPPDKQLGIKTRHFYHLMTITLQANNIKKTGCLKWFAMINHFYWFWTNNFWQIYQRKRPLKGLKNQTSKMLGLRCLSNTSCSAAWFTIHAPKRSYAAHWENYMSLFDMLYTLCCSPGDKPWSKGLSPIQWHEH